MRRLFLALALLAAPLAVAPLAGCASLQQIRPETAREALAEAEIAFMGVISAATQLHAAGHLSTPDAQAMVPTLQRIADAIDAARDLLRAGEAAAALAELNGVTGLIRALSIDLSARAEAARNGA